MNNSAVVIIFAILLMAGLAISASFITAGQSTGGQMLFIFKVAFVYILTTMLVMLLFLVNIYMNIKMLFRKQDNLEKVLFDMRDGKKDAHIEKRQVGRIYGEMAARIHTDDFEEYAEVLNTGYHGALLRCARDFQQGMIIGLKMYLPIFPQPIDIKARVLRSVVLQDPGKAPAYDIAVEYTAISNIDKEKLVETIDVLHEKQIKA